MGRIRLTLAAIAVLASSSCGGGEQSTGDLVARGDELFHGEATCATCRGPDLRGSTMGPPLLDPIYASGHHPDAAIRAAVANGFRGLSQGGDPLGRSSGESLVLDVEDSIEHFGGHVSIIAEPVDVGPADGLDGVAEVPGYSGERCTCGEQRRRAL